MKNEIIDTSVNAARLAAGTSYTVSGGLVVADLAETLNAWAGAIGVFLAVLTFGITWFYKHKEYRLKKAAIAIQAGVNYGRRRDDHTGEQ